jgi:hypothetical protein
MFLACGNAVILPMELRRLDGWAEVDANLLAWEMFNETGYVSHLIERSEDGSQFAEIGELPSTGSEELTSYQYRDTSWEALHTSPGFYRIRSQLADGSEALSPVVEIQRDRTTDYLRSAWPNPVGKEKALHLDFVADGPHQAQMFLTDALGRVVATRTTDLENGLNRLQWTLPPLNAGVYLLQVKTPRTTEQVRVVVE